MRQTTFIRVVRQYASHASRMHMDYGTVVDEVLALRVATIEKSSATPEQKAVLRADAEAVVERDYPADLRLLPYPRKEARVKGKKTAEQLARALERVRSR